MSPGVEGIEGIEDEGCRSDAGIEDVNLCLVGESAGRRGREGRQGRQESKKGRKGMETTD